MSYNVMNEIKKCEVELEKVNNRILRNVKLKVDIETGKKTIYDEYPTIWANSSFKRDFKGDAIKYLDYRIRCDRGLVQIIESKLKRLYAERVWFEVDYYRELDDVDIICIIEHDGIIHGTKL